MIFGKSLRSIRKFSAAPIMAKNIHLTAADNKHPTLASSHECYSKIMKENDTFLFDCDGVIWHGNNAIQGAAQVIQKLRAIGKQVLFVSNNSTKTRDEYFSKFAKLGFDAKLSEVFGTAYASAQYLKDVVSPNGKVYLVGNPAMQEELNRVGVESFGVGADSTVTVQSIEQILQIPLEDNVEAVLVGMDGHISFSKLVKAASYLKQEGCKFVGTNEDNRMPMPGARHVITGTGVMVDAVSSAAGRSPDVWCGKPHGWMLELLKREVPKLDTSRAVMIGDRMNTDMLFGNRHGMTSLLVMSGVETEESLQQACADQNKHESVPNYYLNSLNDWAQY